MKCLLLRKCAHRDITGKGGVMPLAQSLLLAALYSGGYIFCKNSAVSDDLLLKWSAVPLCLTSSIKSLHCWCILLNACVAFLCSSLSFSGLHLCDLYCWFIEASCASISVVSGVGFCSFFGWEYFFCAFCHVIFFFRYGHVSLWLVLELSLLILYTGAEDVLSFQRDNEGLMGDVSSPFSRMPTCPVEIDIKLFTLDEGSEHE